MILKASTTPRTQRRALDTGADAILVSNHGGRQLDGAPSTIRALPAILRAVGPDFPLYLDSGIQSGQEALKAIATGANGVFIGRAYTYGPGAMDQKVRRDDAGQPVSRDGYHHGALRRQRLKDFGPGCLWSGRFQLRHRLTDRKAYATYWRWSRPEGSCFNRRMLQAGSGVVTALHHVPTGTVWSPGEIAKRQAEIAVMTDGAPSGLKWEVVESLPVSEAINIQYRRLA